MATPAHRMNGQKRTVSDQNKLNAKMFEAVLNHEHKELEAALRAGADPNAVGITWPNDPEPSIDPPLITAIYEENLTALKLLIQFGADVAAVDYKGVPGIVTAVDNGHEEMVELLISKKPNLIDAGGINNLLYRSICCLGSYGVLLNASRENPETKAKISILCGYHEELVPRESLPKEPVVLDSKGNLKLVKLLLRLAPEKITDKVEDGFSALDVVQRPTNYSREFWDCDGIKSIRCLPFEADHPKRLCFELSLSARGGDRDSRFKAILRYDLTELCRLLEARVPDQALAANVANHGMRLISTEQNLAGHERRLDLAEQRQDFHFAASEEQMRFEAWLHLPGNENLASFHDIIRSGIQHHMLSFMAADGTAVDATIRELASFRSLLTGAGNLVGLVPVIGNTAQAGVKLLSAGANNFAGMRQQNVVANVVHLLTVEVLTEQSKQLARDLTRAYAQPLHLLATASEAEQRPSGIAKKLQKAKDALTKGHAVSPAEQAANFAMGCMIDHLYHAPDIKDAIKAKGLAHVMLSLIVQRTPKDKMTKHWPKPVKEYFSGKQLLTKAGTYWDPKDFFTLPGIRVLEGSPGFYAHSNSKPGVYGWRLVPHASSEQMHKLKFKPLPASKAPVIEDFWFSEVSSGRDRSNSADYSTGHSNGSSGSQGKQPQASAAMTLAYDATRASKPSTSPIPITMPIFPPDNLGQQQADRQQPRR